MMFKLAVMMLMAVLSVLAGVCVHKGKNVLLGALVSVMGAVLLLVAIM